MATKKKVKKAAKQPIQKTDGLQQNQITIGRRIAEAREELMMTQEELAQALDVSNARIAHWERGRGLPPAVQIPILAKVLELTCNQLLTGRD